MPPIGSTICAVSLAAAGLPLRLRRDGVDPARARLRRVSGRGQGHPRRRGEGRGERDGGTGGGKGHSPTVAAGPEPSALVGERPAEPAQVAGARLVDAHRDADERAPRGSTSVEKTPPTWRSAARGSRSPSVPRQQALQLNGRPANELAGDDARREAVPGDHPQRDGRPETDRRGGARAVRRARLVVVRIFGRAWTSTCRPAPVATVRPSRTTTSRTAAASTATWTPVCRVQTTPESVTPCPKTDCTVEAS